MRPIILLLLIVSGLFSNDLKAGLAERMNDVIHKEQLVGASWALIDGQTVSLGAAGVSSVDSGNQLTTSHKMHLGSIQKTVMAAGVLVMVSSGELSLDARVQDILSNLVFNNPWQNTHPVTVRDLVNHTAGLQNLRLWHLLNTRAEVDTPLEQMFIDDEALLDIGIKPGTTVSYSNVGFNLLALVIETLTGQPYEQVLAERILKPLAMNDSTFLFITQCHGYCGQYGDPQLAFGHLDQHREIEAIPMILRGAGQFTSTPGDMAKFAKFLMSDGKGLISPELIKQIGTPVSTTDSVFWGLNVGGSLGLWRRDRHGVIGLCHGGNTTGFKGNFCIFPDENKAFFFISNSDSETGDYGKLEQVLIESLQITPTPVSATMGEIFGAKDWHIRYEPVLSPVTSFTYIDKLFNTVQLSGDLKKLVLSGLQHPTLILNSVVEGIYQADNRSSASHVLGVEKPGTLTLSTGFTSYRQADNLQFVSLWASLVLGLISLLFLLCRGLYCLLWSRGEHKRLPVVTAFYMFPVLLIPLPFLLTQPFFNFGNINAGSVLLALSCLVALALNVAALWQNRTGNKLDSFAIAGVIQWFLVLAWWGLFPIMLWRI